MKELEQLREIFTTDVDAETRTENERQIAEWEQDLTQNRAFSEWQQLDITRQILKQASDTYKDASMALALRRDLTDTQRVHLWAKQDASAWLISIIDVDARGRIAEIEKQIRVALRAT